MDSYEGMGEDIYYMTHSDPPPWSRSEDKTFEAALFQVPQETPNRWLEIAKFLPGRLPDEIEHHFNDLLHDIHEIEAGRVELPVYSDDLKPGPSSELVKKKRTPWTEEEHKLFLMGLERYGKGDWRSISRNVIRTRTTSQIASHAQKYFERQKMEKKHKKRSSIHDITTPTLPTAMAVPDPAPTCLPAQGPTAMAVPAPTPPSNSFVIPAPAPMYDFAGPDLEPTIYNSWI